jgi:SAM-dependent methyltransferase
MDEIKKWQNHAGLILDSVNGFDVIECDTCGFKHIIPIPTEKEMKEYYTNQFVPERPLYVERMYEDIDWWRLQFSEQYDLFEKYLQPGRRDILDIGCGIGLFLDTGKKRGWNVLGIEPSIDAAEHGRKLGLEIINNVFNDGTAEKLSDFDVINLREVLEHLPNPLDVLKECRTKLKRNGLISVLVPNDYNPFQSLLRDSLEFKPWWVSPPIHINYFDPESLEHILQNAGFEIIEKTSTFPMELFLLMGENYVGNDQLGRNCHSRRKTFELNLKNNNCEELRRRICQSLSQLGLGREILVVGKRI